MLKNVTLSAEKELIEQARRRAEAQNSTLNAEFRRWLEQYVEFPQSSTEFEIMMGQLNYARPGKSFTRDEMNER
jgi:hypothetical protein